MKIFMKILFRLLLLSLPAFAFSRVYSQSETPADATMVLNHIAVHVVDLEKSTSFYENVLQLKKIPEPFHDGLHTWFSIGAAGQLHLIQGAETDITRNKNDHLCFSVKSVDNFVKKLTTQKIPYTNWMGETSKVTTRVDGIKQIYFLDPDGRWIEINDDNGTK
jgi:lactoylglutathione lyase